ncbi:MAG: AraC family transcriptional regulator [Lachnospiraceae bacterium]|nr:AraC family transcriptional regulator [Lachnospiraceae bacterium]
MKRELMGLIVKKEDGSEQVNYDDENFPSYIFEGWVRPNVTWEKVPHFHQDVELVSVKTGKMAYSVNGKTIDLEPGDTIFVNSNQIHYSIATSDEATYVIFIADPGILNASMAVEMQALAPVLTNPKLTYIRFHRPHEKSKDMHRLMLSLPDIRHDPFQVTKKFFDIWEIILEQSRNYGLIETETEADAHTKAFKTMMYYIQNEYKNPITLDDIASSGNVSRSLCNRIFNRFVDKSPVGYLLDYRTRKAAEYLRTTDRPLSEIAYMTGFNGASYMSEMFKRSFGQSPRSYRKTMKGI